MSDTLPPRLDVEQTEENAEKILRQGYMDTAAGQVSLEDYYVDTYHLDDKPGTIEMRFWRKDTSKPPKPRERHSEWGPVQRS